MAKPGFKFFLNPALNREAHYFNRLGMFYAGKVVALDLAAKYKVEPIHILIRLRILLFCMREKAH